MKSVIQNENDDIKLNRVGIEDVSIQQYIDGDLNTIRVEHRAIPTLIEILTEYKEQLDKVAEYDKKLAEGGKMDKPYSNVCNSCIYNDEQVKCKECMSLIHVGRPTLFEAKAIAKTQSSASQICICTTKKTDIPNMYLLFPKYECPAHKNLLTGGPQADQCKWN